MGRISISDKTFKPRLGGGTEFFKGQIGDRIRIRILEKDFEHNFQHWCQDLHRFVNCCLTDDAYDNCPACDNPHRFGAMTDGYKVNVYNYTTKAVEIWSFGNDTYTQLKTIKDIAHNEDGYPNDLRAYDLIVSFSKNGKKKGVQITINKAEGKSKMEKDLLKQLLKKLADLTKFSKPLSPKQFNAKYGVADEIDDDDNDEVDDIDDIDDEPKKTKSKQQAQPDDDDLDFDDDDIDEIEEKPKKSSKSKSKKQDDSDDDFDFEDEDEPPKKSKKSAQKKELNMDSDDLDDIDDEPKKSKKSSKKSKPADDDDLDFDFDE